MLQQHIYDLNLMQEFRVTFSRNTHYPHLNRCVCTCRMASTKCCLSSKSKSIWICIRWNISYLVWRERNAYMITQNQFSTQWIFFTEIKLRLEQLAKGD